MMSAGAALRLATENAASLAALSGECLGRLMTSHTLHGSDIATYLLQSFSSDIATLVAGPGPRPSTTQSAPT